MYIHLPSPIMVKVAIGRALNSSRVDFEERLCELKENGHFDADEETHGMIRDMKLTVSSKLEVVDWKHQVTIGNSAIATLDHTVPRNPSPDPSTAAGDSEVGDEEEDTEELVRALRGEESYDGSSDGEAKGREGAASDGKSKRTWFQHWQLLKASLLRLPLKAQKDELTRLAEEQREWHMWLGQKVHKEATAALESFKSRFWPLLMSVTSKLHQDSPHPPEGLPPPSTQAETEAGLVSLPPPPSTQAEMKVGLVFLPSLPVTQAETEAKDDMDDSTAMGRGPKDDFSLSETQGGLTLDGGPSDSHMPSSETFLPVPSLSRCPPNRILPPREGRGVHRGRRDTGPQQATRAVKAGKGVLAKKPPKPAKKHGGGIEWQPSWWPLSDIEADVSSKGAIGGACSLPPATSNDSRGTTVGSLSAPLLYNHVPLLNNGCDYLRTLFVPREGNYRDFPGIAENQGCVGHKHSEVRRNCSYWDNIRRLVS